MNGRAALCLLWLALACCTVKKEDPMTLTRQSSLPPTSASKPLEVATFALG